MDLTLREQFFDAMMRYKRIEAGFTAECEIQMTELTILSAITGKCTCGDGERMNLNVPNIQEKLQISKPAISYILNVLERKEYITRQIDSRDRRKISISATPEGISAAEQYSKNYDDMWERLISEFGEDDMKRLVELLTRLSAIIEETSCG